MLSFVIWTLLTILKLGASSDCCCETDLDNSFYDIDLKAVSQRMELLESENEILRRKLDALDMNNDKHFGKIKDAVSGICELEKQIPQIHQQEEPKWDCIATRLTTTTIISPPSPDLHHTLTTTTINSTDSPLSSSPSTKTTSSLPSSFHTLTTSTINSTDSPLSSSPSTTTASLLPSSCAEALLRSSEPKNGPQLIHVPNSNLDPFFVYCLLDPRQDGATWTIIQRRLDGAINFYRNWNEYRRGFGNVEGEFFIGLERLHALTQSAAHELWIQMEDFENATRWAKYKSFAVGDESDGYALNQLGAFSGDAGDSLTNHAGQKFTTYDKDNDQHPTENCAIKFTSAWWYNKCHKSHLNGQYLNGEYSKEMYAQGIDWYTWHGHYYSLKYVHMAIRPIHAEK